LFIFHLQKWLRQKWLGIKMGFIERWKTGHFWIGRRE
jgi:hypothetical protein